MRSPKNRQHPTEASFDEFADSYDQALEQGLAVTGEDRKYFARRRIEWLRSRLDASSLSVKSAIEFGCGTGTNIPFLLTIIGAESVLGIDVSDKSLQKARDNIRSERVRFLHRRECRPDNAADLIFCNGVFHHIPPADRPGALRFLFAFLKRGGVLAMWENNPWNPGTRYVMKQIPFDADAVMISAPRMRDLLRFAGFEIIYSDFLFIFPHALRWMRFMERPFARLPLGGQYMLLCRRQ